MSKSRLFGRIFGLLFVLGVIWGVFLISRTILERSENTNGLYIPLESDFVVRVDGKKLVKTGLSDVFFNAQDEDVIKLLQNMLEKRERNEDHETHWNVGIDFTSDMYVFHLKEGINPQIGVLLNLRNQKRFDEYIGHYLNPDQGFASNEDVGLILSERIVDSSKVKSQDELSALALIYLNKNKFFDVSKFDAEGDQEKSKLFAKTWNKRLNREIDEYEESTVAFELDDHEIRFEGSYDGTISNNDVPELKPDGLHLHFAGIPHGLVDSIKLPFLDMLSEDLSITGLSLNYRGAEMIELPEFMIAPDADMVIKTKSPCSLESMIDSAKVHLLVDTTSNIQGVQISGTYYHVKQLDPTTIYFGRRKPNFLDQAQAAVTVSGPVAPLMKIDGDGMMRKLLNCSLSLLRGKTSVIKSSISK